jgi:hypothetical protein
MIESVKAKETAKKKVTRKLNPEETMVRGPEEPVESDQALVAEVGAGSSEVLASGYRLTEVQDLDPWDNERNYNRVRPEVCGTDSDPVLGDDRSYNKILPASKYGAKKKQFDQDSEDYGKKETLDSDHQDD